MVSEAASKARILIADDDDLVRMIVSMALEDEGFETVEAASLGAITTALDGSPALVILDINIPGATIDETLTAISSRGASAPSVLVLSGDSTQEAAMNARGIPFLAKPVDVDVLVSHVARLTASNAG